MVAGNIPGTKVLNFDATGYIDCGTSFDVGGRAEAALGIWLSTEDHFADANYAISKDAQIAIQHYGTDDRIRFGVHIDGSWQWVTSDANISPMYGRTFAMGVYDATNLLLYVNGKIHKTQTRTGAVAAIDASAAHLYIAAKTSASGYFHGVLAEAMAWTRSVSAQEVQELYFFPLARLVKKSASPLLVWESNFTVHVIDGDYSLFSGVNVQFHVVDGS